MGSVTPIVVPGEGYTRVEVDMSEFTGTRKSWVYRTPTGGTRTLLRDGNPARLSAGRCVCYDTEAPLDVPVRYRSLVALNANGDMEDGVSEWVAGSTNSIVTQTFDYFVPGEGVAALKALPVFGAGATVEIMSELVPVTVGTLYIFAGQVMLPRWWNGGVCLIARFFTAGLAVVSTIAPAADVTPPAGQWNSGSPHYSFGNTAPATSAFVRIGMRVSGTPPVDMPIYLDEMYITTAASAVDAPADVIQPSNGGGWWKDPLHPATMTRLQTDLRSTCAVQSGAVYLGVSGKSRPSDSVGLEINDSPYSIGSWSKRKSGRQSIRVGCLGTTDVEQIDALHASGAPLLLQLPAEYNEPDAYGLYGDTETSRLAQDQRRPWRVVSAPFAEVEAPIGPPEGVFGVRWMDLDKYGTFALAASSGVGGAYDTFSRVTASGWGTPNVGPAWTVNGTASWYSTTGSRGAYLMSTVGADRSSEIAVSVADFDITISTISTSAAPATDNSEQRIRARYVNGTNFVEASIFRLPGAGVPTVRVRQFVAGVDTGSAFLPIVGATGASTFSLRFRGNGTSLQAWAWIAGGSQPATPTASFTTSFLSAGLVQLSAQLYGGVTNAPLTFEWDDIIVSNLATGLTWFDVLQGEAAA